MMATKTVTYKDKEIRKLIVRNIRTNAFVWMYTFHSIRVHVHPHMTVLYVSTQFDSPKIIQPNPSHSKQQASVSSNKRTMRKKGEYICYVAVG